MPHLSDGAAATGRPVRWLILVVVGPLSAAGRKIDDVSELASGSRSVALRDGTLGVPQPTGVTVTSSPDPAASADVRRRAGIDEAFRDAPAIESVDDLAAPGVFESDEELDEFLACVRAERNANLA